MLLLPRYLLPSMCFVYKETGTRTLHSGRKGCRWMSITISASSLLPGLDMRAMLHAQGGTATDPSHAFSHSIPGSGRKHRTLDGPL
jgi:hypothetical protein